MPSRIVREGINTSDRINSLSEFAELCYRRLLNIADDHGRFSADLELLRVNLFPFESGGSSNFGKYRVRPAHKRIKAAFGELCKKELITIYGNGRYLLIHNFRQQYRTKSKFPDPNDLTPDKQKLSGCYPHDKHTQRLFVSEGEDVGESVLPDAKSQADVVLPLVAAPALPSAPPPVPGEPEKPEPKTPPVPGVYDNLKLQLGNLYQRPPAQLWSYLEETLLAEISHRPEALSEFQLIANYRRRLSYEDKKFFPALPGLLQNWNGTLDRARMSKPQTLLPSKPTLPVPSGPTITDEQRTAMAAELKELREKL